MDVTNSVAKELSGRGWTLVSAHHDFMHLVRQELALHFALADEAPAEQVKRATVRCYARVLFAQSGEDGTFGQHEAFKEIRAFLFPRAMYQVHDRIRAEDAVQRALLKIYEKRTTCREPGNFLRWCDQILQHLIIDDRRAESAEQKTEHGIEYGARQVGFYAPGATVNEDLTEEEDTVADPSQDTPHAAMTEPMRAAMLEVLRDCLGDDRQVEVLGQLFINDKTFLEISDMLHISPANVQVIRHRALEKLRNCGGMQQLVEDWDYP